MHYEPAPHHSTSIDWLLERPAAALWVDMGGGKTGSTATVIERLLDQVEVSRVLIVGTPRIAGKVWLSEFRKWDHLRRLGQRYYNITKDDLAVARVDVVRKGETVKVQKLVNPRELRNRLYQRPAEVFTIHYDLLGRLAKLFGDKWPFDCVIMDESSMVSNQDTTRFRALRRVRGHVRRLYQLTGTPASNGLEKLFSQVFLLDGGRRLGRTLTQFRENYMMPGEMDRSSGRVYRWTPRPGAREKIYAAVSDICLSIDSGEWGGDGIETIINRIPVTLPPKARELYDRVERDYIARLNGKVIEAESAAVLGNKLLQICNGTVYDSERGAHAVHDEKLETLAELQEATAGQLLLAYWYDHDRARIRGRFGKAVEMKEDPDFEEHWNAGQVGLGMMQAASGAHGLNLQDGGSNAVWYGPIYNLEIWLQFNKRLPRKGQKAKRVLINVMVVEDSIEEDVMSSLASKQGEQDALLAAVRRRIERVEGVQVDE